MSKFFYVKLAFSNIKKNARIYVPYMLTCMGTIMMYYIIRGLALNQSMRDIRGGNEVQMIMGFGSWIIGIFAVIFLFYTNSFLIKRRKKEFGLYNILGMEKRHLGRVVFWESVDTFLISMAAGVGFGVLFSELVYLCVERALEFEMSLKFEIVPRAIAEAAILFGIIFVINLLNTLRQIHLANPVELLKGGNVGEKEPKTRWILTSVGFLFLGVGYYMAATVENPIDAMLFFFLAVILVVIATYCLFTAGSIAILKFMRKRKNFYYKRNHFISVSGMMYRMKQNAAGLASICVLSTGVLILISTTVCMYLGTEDAIRVRYPRNIYFDMHVSSKEVMENVQEIKEKVLAAHGVKSVDEVAYERSYYTVNQSGNRFGEDYGNDKTTKDYANIECITLQDYNRLAGKDVSLAEDEVLLCVVSGEVEENTMYFGDTEFRIKEKLEEFPLPTDNLGNVVNTYWLVLPDKDSAKRVAEGISLKSFWKYYCAFDINAGEDVQLQVYEDLLAELQASGMEGSVRSAAEGRSSFLALNGGVLFLGIFLGFLFMMATVLIIYYKQISEGYDDRERYQIMRKVGMSRKEVKSSIRSQVLTVFYLPLIAAGVHIFFAFNMIRRMLFVFGLYNVRLFAVCTVTTMLLFGLLYCLVYGRTAKTYYKIIS